MTKTYFILKILVAAFITITIASFSGQSRASSSAKNDYPADSQGNCPKGHDRISKSELGRPASKWCRPPEASSSSSKSSSSSGPTYVDPSFAEVGKLSPLTRCPTGYYTRGDKCNASWSEAPKTRLKTGTCPTGTLEEWGAFCTDVAKDTSDKALDMMDGNLVRDFNVLFVAYQSAGKILDSAQDSAVFAAAKASRVAAGNPWNQRSDRDQDEAATKKAAEPVVPALTKAEVSPECHSYMPDRNQVMQCESIVKQQRASQAAAGLSTVGASTPSAGASSNEAGKALGNAVGGALKGLFSK